MGRGLLLRCDCLAEPQNLCDDWFDFSCIDELRDFCEIRCIRMNRYGRAMNAVLLKLGPIGECDQRHDDTAFLHYAIRTDERILADRIEHRVYIFGHVFESGFRVINCDIYAELLEKILVCCRSSGDDACTMRLGDLNCEATNTA